MNYRKISSFTFLEVIVTIAIITILGIVTSLSLLKWFSKSKDAKRLGDINIIMSALEDYRFNNGYYPEPGDNVPIKYGTETIGNQGYIDSSISQKLDLKTHPTDPVFKEPYTYYLNQGKDKFQLLVYLENEKKLDYSLSSHLKVERTFAENYEDRHVFVRGDKLGTIISSGDKTPVQKIFTGFETLDLKTYKENEITAVLENNFQISGTGKDIMKGKTIYRPDLSSIDKELSLYFDFNEGIGEETEGQSSYNHTGTINGPTRIEGVSGKGLYRENTTGTVKINDHSSLDITEDFSISYRIKPLEKTNSSTNLLSKGNSYGLTISGNKILGYTDANASAVSGLISERGWHNLTLNYNNSKLQLYIDGEKKDEINGSSPETNNEPLIIGDETQNFYGSIDEIRIYQKSLEENILKALFSSLK